jgi:hypothetical protein
MAVSHNLDREREREIYQLKTAGLTYAQIAARFGVARPVVSRAHRKLQAEALADLRSTVIEEVFYANKEAAEARRIALSEIVWQPCRVCDGSGDASYAACPMCHRGGVVVDADGQPVLDAKGEPKQCPKCEGRLELRIAHRDTDLCGHCQGTGYNSWQSVRLKALEELARVDDHQAKLWGLYAPERIGINLRVAHEIPFLAEVVNVTDDELEGEWQALSAPIGGPESAFGAAAESAARRALPKGEDPRED